MKDHNKNGSENTVNYDIDYGQDRFGKTLYLEYREGEAFSRLHRLIAKLGIVIPTIFDVSAYVGQSIEKFKQIWPTAEIHSFEPNPSTFIELSQNWGDTCGIVLNNVALSDSNKMAPFHATRISEVASLLSPTKRMRQISVEYKYDYELISIQTKTLDDYCIKSDCAGIDILKIDVQGSELAVLKGAHAQLQKRIISIIYVETTFADCYEGQTSYSDLVAYLSLCGISTLGYSPISVYKPRWNLGCKLNIPIQNGCGNTGKIVEDIQ